MEWYLVKHRDNFTFSIICGGSTNSSGCDSSTDSGGGGGGSFLETNKLNYIGSNPSSQTK
jgi:hypothetical protein